MRKNALFPSLLVAAGLALTGCSSDAQTASENTSATPSATPSTSPEPTSASAGPTTAAPTATETTPATDLLAAFLATDAGAPYTGAVTGIELLGGTNGGIPVHRIDTNLTDPAKAVEICTAYQSEISTGQEQINVLDPSESFLATTNGDPETCVTEGTQLETVPPAPDPTDGAGESGDFIGAPPVGGEQPHVAIPPRPDVSVDAPYTFTYDQAYAAWQNGMPYYQAFCVNYMPVTDGGVSQCEGIDAGTVDYTTGEYIGPR